MIALAVDVINRLFAGRPTLESATARQRAREKAATSAPSSGAGKVAHRRDPSQSPSAAAANGMASPGRQAVGAKQTPVRSTRRRANP